MCGIAGIITFNGTNAGEATIRKMTDGMAHRGPDSDGFFVEGPVAFGHRRLSIIDLSTAANQPFTDHSGRYVMVFNGEMYNYSEIKAQLPAYPFRTTSDTEALLAAYIAWGPDCINRFRGMFAFVIWDRQEQVIFMARDRMGVKPLYYHIDQNRLLFASENRALLATGMIDRKISQEALADYFSYQSVSYPLSVVEGIRQLEAGSWMRIRQGRIEQQVYWSVSDKHGDEDFSDKKKVQARIRELMLQSVSRRLVSDVPVGAFLSGGIDSSAVVGLMAEASTARPNTFNICFDEKEFDESEYAEIIAAKFNTEHTRILLKPSTFLDELQNGLDAMDTPSGDGINTYVVSKVIRQKGVTVALSGVGGDELFAGYPYFNQYRQLQAKSWMWNLPAGIRKLAALSQQGAKRDRLRQILGTPAPSIENIYPVFRQILSPAALADLTTLQSSSGLQANLMAKKDQIARLPLLSQVSVAEYLGYTQHTLLKDTDQMSMAVSLEVREPFFDNDLVEYVLAVPDAIKGGPYAKSLLVESLAPMLPDDIVFRKKQGFLFPWNIWLKNELRSFCDRHIRNMAARPFINGGQLEKLWQQFLAGDNNIRWAECWLFVVLDYWMEKNQVS